MAGPARQSGKLPVDWYIKDLDHNKTIWPQFPLRDGVRTTTSGNVVDQPRFGIQDPIVQWVSGKIREFTFETMLFSRYATEDISTTLRDLEKLALMDKKLGRPPICLFSYGDVTSEIVIVESVASDIADVIPTIAVPREVRLSITLKKYQPFTQNVLDPSKPLKESFFLVAMSAERSYEAIAKRFYGDPLFGDRLRKRHPGAPMAPEIGQVVKVPSKAVILSEVVKPSSHVFDLENEDTVAAYETILLDRGARKLVTIV